jgi:hypothetical protein
MRRSMPQGATWGEDRRDRPVPHFELRLLQQLVLV